MGLFEGISFLTSIHPQKKTKENKAQQRTKKRLLLLPDVNIMWSICHCRGKKMLIAQGVVRMVVVHTAVSYIHSETIVH